MAPGHRPGIFSTSSLVTWGGERAANDDEFPIVSSLAPHLHLVDRKLSQCILSPMHAVHYARNPSKASSYLFLRQTHFASS